MGTKLDELIAKKNALKAEMREKGSDALKESFKEFFEAHPECVALRWTQYTPYFNDGEPCEFGVCDFYVKMKDTHEDAGDYGDGFEYNPDGEAGRAASRAADKLNVDDELFEIAFGDHAKVTATREGFEVEEYQHD